MNAKVKVTLITLAVVLLLSYAVGFAGIWDLADFETLASGQRQMKTQERSLDLDSFGTLHVCWVTGRSAGGFMIHYSQKPCGEDWSTPEVVLDSSVARSRPAIAVDKNTGVVFIAYNEEEEVYFAENATGEWQPHQITDNEVDDYDPDVAVDPGGAVHLAWITVDQYGDYKIAYGTDLGGVWQSQVLEDSYIGDYGLGASPVVAVEPDGKAHLAYRGDNYGNYHIHHAENDQPGGISWDIQFLSSPNREDLIADVGVMPEGELHLGLAGRDDWFAPSRGYYLHRPAGSQNWDAAQAVAPAYELTDPKIDADSDDNVHIVWEVLSGNMLMGVFAYSENTTGSWVTDHLLGQGEARKPSFLVDEGDQGQLFYYAWEDGVYSIVYYGSPIITSPVIIGLRPHDDTVAAGGTLAYTGVGTNTTGQLVRFDYWAKVELPTGPVIDPIFGPKHLRLPRNTTDSVVVRHRVPVVAPPGTYVYTGMVGEYPEPAWYSDSFEFVVVSPTGDMSGAPSQWQVSGYKCFGFGGEQAPPTSFSLCQNYPNPFNATTVIDYELAASGHVRLEVYSILGWKVATLVDGRQEAGYHSVIWDASAVSSGVYFYKLAATAFSETKEMILIK